MKLLGPSSAWLQYTFSENIHLKFNLIFESLITMVTKSSLGDHLQMDNYHKGIFVMEKGVHENENNYRKSTFRILLTWTLDVGYIFLYLPFTYKKISEKYSPNQTLTIELSLLVCHQLNCYKLIENCQYC